MIRVHKPNSPAILLNRGRTTAQRLRDLFDATPGDFLSGASKFEFDNGLYAAASVKNALKRAQHGKCAFCESKFEHVAYGDVEHYRPKAGFVQQEGDALGRPGYYWLAYEWDNLFFSCQLCNQRFKKNLFPLADPASRARSHNDNLASETALLLHPTSDDPTAFLSFRDEVAFAVAGGPRGLATIEVLGLNRAELIEERKKQLTIIELMRDGRRRIAEEPPSPERDSLLARYDAQLRDFRDDRAEFAAMCRAALAIGT